MTSDYIQFHPDDLPTIIETGRTVRETGGIAKNIGVVNRRQFERIIPKVVQLEAIRTRFVSKLNEFPVILYQGSRFVRSIEVLRCDRSVLVDISDPIACKKTLAEPMAGIRYPKKVENRRHHVQCSYRHAGAVRSTGDFLADEYERNPDALFIKLH